MTLILTDTRCTLLCPTLQRRLLTECLSHVGMQVASGSVTFEDLLLPRDTKDKELKQLSASLHEYFSWSDKPIRVQPGQSSKGFVSAREYEGFIVYSSDSSIAKVRKASRA